MNKQLNIPRKASLHFGLILFASLGWTLPALSEGSQQFGSSSQGLNVYLFEYNATNGFVQTNQGPRPIKVNVESANQVINISLCGWNTGDDLAVEVFRPSGTEINYTTQVAGTSPGAYSASAADSAGAWLLTQGNASTTDQTTLCNSQSNPTQPTAGGTLSNPIRFVAPEAGIYEIRLYNDSLAADNTNNVLTYFDVTVTSNTSTNPNPRANNGQLWADSWALNAGNTFAVSGSYDADLYIRTPGGRIGTEFVWQLDLNQFAPQRHEIIANGIGLNAPNSRGSFQGSGAAYTKSYPIYLSPPNTASFIAPILPEPASPTVTNLSFIDNVGEDNTISPSSTVNVQDSGVFKFDSDIPGTYKITIDTNQNGVFGAGDRVLFGSAISGTNQVAWDGKGDNNAALNPGSYPVEITVGLGEYHFVAFDAETSGGTSDGLSIWKWNGGSRSTVSNFWDDTKITSPAGATKNLVGGLSGTTAGSHTWGNFNSGGIGNTNYLDTWVFGSSQTQTTKAIIANSDANDFGDAPDTFGTNKNITVGGSPASQLINANLHLGVNAPDIDADGQPSVNADGDDLNGTTPDDEDGVISFSPLLTNATTYSVTVRVKNTTGAATSLGGWIDFNRDGQFQSSEGVVQSVPNNTNGNVSLTWNGLSGLTVGDIHARFRLNNDLLTTSDFKGGGRDGEVEDYKLAIASTDYGDAPDSYGTNSTNNNSEGVGANHVIVNTLNLGANAPDAETDAPTTLTGTQDDSTGTDDEDGIATPFPALNTTTNTYSLTATVNNTTGSAANVFAWIDFDRDGKFDVDERATVTSGSVNLVSGQVPTGTTNKTVTLTWSSLGGSGTNVASGNSYLRIRLTTDNLTNTGSPTTARDTVSVGNASNGEVEDYPIAIAQARDYGDAPDAATGTSTGNYQTTLADGGASQAVINVSGQVLKLGSNLDQDSGSLHDPTAQADDNNGTDDEDGVSSFPFLTTTAGQTYVVPVTVSNNVSAAYLVGYIDFNKDGDFNDNGERSVIDLNNDGDFNDNGEQSANVSVSSSATNPRIFNVTFSTPTGMTTGSTYARFRLSQSTTTAGLPTGASADTDYGEVEDYQIAIAAAPTVPTSVTTSCTAPASLVSPSAFTLNSSNYLLSSPLQSLITPSNPLSLYNGTMRFNATLSGTGTWGNGVQLRTDPSFGNHLYLQPKDTNAYITSGNRATYEFLFPSGVKNFSTIVGGLNNYDGTTITASYLGTPVSISAANFSNLSTGMTLSDTNIDTDTNVDTVISTNTTGGVEVTENIYTLTIPDLIDKITVYSGKDGASNVSTATIGFSLIGYCANFDYGDAPDTYGTDSTNSSSGEGIGARHGVTSTLKLGGNAPDAETNAPSTLNGNGDDSTGTPDDEDGITTPFPALTTTTNTYSLTTTVNNTTGSAANIYGWIDFDGDGKFDGDERATVGNGTVALNGGKVPTGANGTVILTWNNLGGSGANIVSGASYARVRLTTDDLTTSAITSTARDTASVGTASNGEVEDYPIAIAGTDYGDAPDTYGTDKTDSGEGVGARHTILTTTSLRFGATNPDAETDAQAPLNGTGDDLNGTDDEEGIATFPSLNTATDTYSLTVRVRNNTTSLANVYGWIDFDGDGKFDGDERATVGSGTSGTVVTPIGGLVPIGANGNITLTWINIGGLGANIVNSKTYARIRITTDNLTTSSGTTRDPASVGSATNGEVEDYEVAIAATDYGDAPDTYGTNSTDDNGEGIGARHVITSALKLGTNAPDGETNAPITLTGTQDDTTGTDDEDAFTTLANVPTVGHYNLTVPLSNNGDKVATLRAWVDFDRDGKFEEGEYKQANVPINATSVDLSWTVPGGMTAGATYARFRLTSTALTDVTSTLNQDERSIGAANDGEVEDYPVAIAPNGNPPLPPDFCQISTGHNFLFVLDDSSSVIAAEVQQQKDAVMATLNSFIAKGLTGQAAIVGFDTIGRKIIDYTAITAANLGAFQSALNSNYGVDGSGTNWEAGLQAGALLGVSQPDAVFFFTDGTQNTGASPEDEATQFKLAGAHIFGIGIELGIEGGFRHITDGDDSVVYNGSNALEADFVGIDDYASLETQYTNDFLANLCSADFGDALDTYGTDYIANNNSSDPLGANHRIVSGLYLGAKAPDAESNGFGDGTDDHNNATDDDEPKGTGTGNGDDEGKTTFPVLNAGKKGYRIPAANITVTNTTGQNATLHAWIDFDKNGKFDPTEYTSILVPQGTTNNSNLTANLTWSGITVGATGNTYARFRLTSDTSINNATPGGAASSGEVEDYQIAIANASDPNLLLVKRITAINPGKPDEILFNNFVNDPNTLHDNDSLWPDPNVYLRGAIDAEKVKPGDEVEYTVYFLSSGKENAKEVNICDVVPDQMTFVKNTYGVELGIGLGLDSAALPTIPNLKLSNLLNDDQGDFYGPGATPPANLCKKVSPSNTSVNVNGTNNDNGAVVVKIPDLPKANTPGNPMDSYGFIRFRAKVK